MIRECLEKDIKDINRLGFLLYENFTNIYHIKEYLENKKYIILVSENKNQINGFLLVYQNIDYYELLIIIVDNNWQGQGIATNLLEFFEKNYLKNGDSILLEVAINNEKAINLYKKFAYKVISTRKKYYNNIDAYVMKKVIE